MVKTGEMGYPSALMRLCGASTTSPSKVNRSASSPVRFLRHGKCAVQNLLPGGVHSQTAVEAAMTLYEQMQAAAKRRQISKK